MPNAGSTPSDATGQFFSHASATSRGERSAAMWPASFAPLVGREKEVAELTTLLSDSQVRLITLTGPGGVGKTRLVLEMGNRLRDRFEDGVVFISLAPVTDPDLVPVAIAREFEVRQAGDQPLVDRLRQELTDWTGLLILDNFEQVIEASLFVASLLTECPNLKVMVSSRTLLRVSDEREYAVSPLALPQGPSSMAAAQSSAAVALFLQRATSVRPTFTVNPENVEAVIEICRRLDGLPLAIELAAARSKVLSPSALLSRLNHSLQILTNGPHDQPNRLQTMRDAIRWSYDLLSPDEQMLFHRLSVFAGGFSIEAAEQIGRLSDQRDQDAGLYDTDSSVSVLDLLTSLADKSLLQYTDAPDGEPRFTLLETVREFGLEQLAASGEMDTIRVRHAVWCQNLADAAQSDWQRRHEVDRAVRRLDREHDNLRLALGYLKGRDAVEELENLAGSLSWFWLSRGYVREGLAWLAPTLESGDRQVSHSRSRALLGAGMLAHYVGDEVRAQPFLRQALEYSRTVGDRWLTTQALIELGIDEGDQGRFESAVQLFDEAVTIAREDGDRIALAQSLSHRGLFGWAMGDVHAAEELVLDALLIQRAIRDTAGLGHSLSYLGLFACERGDAAKAGPLIEESLASRLEIGATQYLPWSFENVGLYASVLLRPVEAVRLFSAAATLRDRIGSPGHEPELSAYQRALESTQALLEASVFAEAWATGRTYSFDDGIAASLAVLASAPSPEVPAVPVAAATKFGLTSRELDVLRLLVEGRTDREIGDDLFISFRTAQKHVANIYLKLNVGSRTAAVTLAHRSGLV